MVVYYDPNGSGYNRAPPYPVNPPVEDDEYLDEVDAQEEAFFSELDRLSSQGGDHHRYGYPSGTAGSAAYPGPGGGMNGAQRVELRTVQEKDFNFGEIVETSSEACAAARRTIGDFEVFRLARQGGSVLEACKEVAQLLGIDIHTSIDNAERNILHYAVDSGDVELVRALRQFGVPVKPDAKGMTPAHVAVVISGADEEKGQTHHTHNGSRLPSSLKGNESKSGAALLEALLAALATEAGVASRPSFAALAVLSPEERERDKVLQRWAPPPPRFVFSAPAPAPPVLPHGAPARRFWGRLPSEVVGKGGKSYSSAVMGQRGGEVSSVSVRMGLTKEEVEGVWDRIQSTYLPPDHTLDAWSLPFSRASLESRSETLLAVQVNSSTSERDRKLGLEGKGVAQLLAFRMDGGGKAKKEKGSVTPPPSWMASEATSKAFLPLASALWVGMMGVAPSCRQQGKAVELLCRLASIPVASEQVGGKLTPPSSANSLSSVGEKERGSVILPRSPHLPCNIQRVVFAIPDAPLPAPYPTATCLIKLFRRSLQPLTALRHSLLFEKLYHEFDENHCILRTDVLLKESITTQQRERISKKTTADGEGVLEEWELLLPWKEPVGPSSISTASEEEVEEKGSELLEFLQASFSTVGKEMYELGFVPLTLAEIGSSLLAAGMITVVRRPRGTGEGKRSIQDVVTYRIRAIRESTAEESSPSEKEGRSKHPATTTTTASVVVAEVVYAHLPSFSTSGPEKVEQILLVAEKYLHATTLLVPNMFGITDSDAGKAGFTECVPLRRMLYVIDHSESITKDVGGKHSAPKGAIGHTSPPIKIPVPAPKISIPLVF